MRKITLFLLSLVFTMTALQAQNSLLVSESLPGKLTDGQYYWTSEKLTAPEGEFKTLRVTFLQNSNGEQPAGFPCITIAEFYLYDKDGNQVKLTEERFSSNATQDNEGKISALCNGFTTKQDGEGEYDWYWHSKWSGEPNPYGYHYLEIDLKDIEADLSQYSIGWVTRRSQASPAKIIISAGASTDDACKNANRSMLPKVSKENNIILYTIKSLRSKNYWEYTQDNAKPIQTGNITTNGFWYFTEGADGKVIIHNFATGLVLDKNCEMKEEGEWYISPATYTPGLTIAQNANGVNDCIDDQNGSIGFWNHSKNDFLGTTWIIEQAGNCDLPFTLTTDDKNPALYAIKSGRNNDNKEWYYTYNASGANIALTQFTGEDTQYWYFKAAAHKNLLRVQIYPYAGEGKVMSYKNTNNEADNVSAQTVGAEDYTQQWILVATDGKAPYGMQTNGGENHLSNNGGVGNKMGMWNATPKNDSGSAMYFYSLSDMVTTKIADLQDTADNVGNGVGQYSNAPEGLVEEVENAKNAKTNEELIAAYKNLVKINISGLKINMPVEGNIYTIKNQKTNFYMNVSDASGATVYNDAALNELFQFIPVKDDMFYLYNVKRAKYLSSAPGHGWGQVVFEADNIDKAKAVTIASLGVANQVSITPEGGAMLHNDTNYSTVVGWNTGANDKSAWFIEEVTNPADYVHTLKVDETGWATLYLGCDVAIPEGVEAYTVKEIVENSAVIEPVAGVIPAKCPVIIKAEAGEYSFAYSAEAGVANETNLLVGTTVKANIAKEAYVLDNSTEPSFVKAVYNVSTDTTNDGTEEEPNVTYEAFLNNAFCAYLPKADEMEADFYTLSIASDDNTTAIENVEMANENEEIYDITGRKVNAITARGIYIINGKKVIK